MKRNPSTLAHLVNALKQLPANASLAERRSVVEKYDVPLEEFKPYIKPNPLHYNREIFETNAIFQGLILTWKAGQKSCIHNHKHSQCIVRVLRGNAIETVYHVEKDLTFITETSIYPSGSILCGEDADIHTVENAADAKQNLVTMHLYFPALENMECFTIRGNRLLPSD